MAHRNDVIEYGIECARAYGTGNHGPRMLVGNLELHVKFEKLLAKFFGTEHCLVLSSGYLACVSAI